MTDHVSIKVKSHVEQYQAQVFGLSGPDGKLLSVELKSNRFSAQIDPRTFPFLEPGQTCYVTVQITTVVPEVISDEQPLILPPSKMI